MNHIQMIVERMLNKVMLNGKVAIVTGASRGIGEGIALSLARHGADIIINATTASGLTRCKSEIESLGRKVVIVAGDVSLPETAETLIAAALQHFGKIDIVVNSAGINRDGMLHKMTDENWKRVLDVNLNGTFYLTRRAAVEMRKQKSGRIINMGSSAWNGNFGQANYAASKGAIVALTKSAAKELGGLGITCNVLCPGLIETDMTKDMPEAARMRMLARIPSGKMGTPEDVGELVAFLSSDAAGYINGEMINIGGGFSL